MIISKLLIARLKQTNAHDKYHMTVEIWTSDQVQKASHKYIHNVGQNVCMDVSSDLPLVVYLRRNFAKFEKRWYFDMAQIFFCEYMKFITDQFHPMLRVM